MRLDEVTQLSGGLCLHLSNGDIVHMDVEEARDAVDKLIATLSANAKPLDIPLPDAPLFTPSEARAIVEAMVDEPAKVLPFRRRRGSGRR